LFFETVFFYYFATHLASLATGFDQELLLQELDLNLVLLLFYFRVDLPVQILFVRNKQTKNENKILPMVDFLPMAMLGFGRPWPFSWEADGY